MDIKNKKVILGKVVHFDSDTEYLNKTKENIYAILNFDYVEPFNNYMKGENKW